MAKTGGTFKWIGIGLIAVFGSCGALFTGVNAFRDPDLQDLVIVNRRAKTLYIRAPKTGLSLECPAGQECTERIYRRSVGRVVAYDGPSAGGRGDRPDKVETIRQRSLSGTEVTNRLIFE